LSIHLVLKYFNLNHHGREEWQSRSVGKRSYCSMATTGMPSEATSSAVISSITKQILWEIKKLSSLEHHSLLRDDIEAVKNFSWETVWGVLEDNLSNIFS